MLFIGRTVPLKGITNQGVPLCYVIQIARHILAESSRGIKLGCDRDGGDRRGHLFAGGQTLNKRLLQRRKLVFPPGRSTVRGFWEAGEHSGSSGLESPGVSPRSLL